MTVNLFTAVIAASCTVLTTLGLQWLFSRRSRIHPRYRYAVTLDSWGAGVVDEKVERIRLSERVVRRGLTQGQAYGLKMDINRALKIADDALATNQIEG